IYVMTGWAYHHLGKQDRAIELLEAAIPLNPDSWAAYYHLGYVYSRVGKPEQAVAMFEEVLERRPNYPEIEAEIATLKKEIAARQSAQREIK
ncbi:MAG: tetratricopeptide repeat protein, partial [Nitrospira sp.]|nr:tetratricopeptide repeat protein [Nitrospira sp.]